ncbi:MAG: thiamine pyrophosphokinase, partial [Primorskyibacter sp.]
DGLDMAPTGRIGTSNEATRARVTLCFDRPGMVLLLPRHAFDAMLKACYAHWHPRTAPRDAL